MTSKEALERIKSKYKGCLIKEAHKLPFSSDINIENIEEYWHIENKNDFSQIEKDLEILEQLEILKEYYSPFKKFLEEMFEKGYNKDLTKVKEWLENDN